MYPLYYDTIQAMFDHLYSKQEALVIPEAMDTPSDQRSGKNAKMD